MKTLLLIIIIAIAYQELVVQVTDTKYIPILKNFVQKKSSTFEIIQYLTHKEGQKKTFWSSELERYLLIETDLNLIDKEALRKELYDLPYITASFIKPEAVVIFILI
jgi:hypothetical protein